MSKAKANFSRWTSEENELFEKLLGIYNKDFRKIAQHFKTRSYGQLRTHYYNEIHKQVGVQEEQINSPQSVGSASHDSVVVAVLPPLPELFKMPKLPIQQLPIIPVVVQQQKILNQDFFKIPQMSNGSFNPYDCESFMFSTYFQ
ncbi:SANT/Myb_domain [Hexamita inflata]|uniref:SANT/Myb domain n=1 Tax=Hexamita inflata TaxID=28002 RepID=A0AA86V209_9EUKA|nr:SANT/Myb domain [Hexamita inflata]